MKWITRERPKIDRIACPWLILPSCTAEPRRPGRRARAAAAGTRRGCVGRSRGRRARLQTGIHETAVLANVKDVCERMANGRAEFRAVLTVD